MPSQEDYLDGLLKELSENEEQQSKASGSSRNDAPEIDDIGNMSEDDIIRLLSASDQKETGGAQSAADTQKQEQSKQPADRAEQEDDDLQAIRELLEQADKGASPESGKAAAQDTDADFAAHEASSEDTAQTSDTAGAEGKRQRKEAAARKKAAKEEAKRQKAQARAAAKAAKAEKRKAAKGKAGAADDEGAFDTSVLDEIVSGAEGAANAADGGGQDISQLLPAAAKARKKGFFARVLDFFTEEEVEQEDNGNENLPISEENKGIIKELDKEKAAGKKAKKTKKKGKGKQEASEEQKNGADNARQRPKKEKPKKEKKERKKKTPEETGLAEEELQPLIPEKKLTLKRVLPIALIAVSVGLFIIIFVNASVNYSDKREAHAAFYEGDYQTCYQNLFGKELNETEQVMYGKSESILHIRLWLREYEMFASEGSDPEALDSLIQTVHKYPELYAYAQQWNAGQEVADVYTQILALLSERYGLTEEQAQSIADEPDDVQYTRMVLAITQGKDFGSWNQPQEPELPVQEPLEDELPEEEGLGTDIFVNNQ